MENKKKKPEDLGVDMDMHKEASFIPRAIAAARTAKDVVRAVKHLKKLKDSYTASKRAADAVKSKGDDFVKLANTKPAKSTDPVRKLKTENAMDVLNPKKDAVVKVASKKSTEDAVKGIKNLTKKQVENIKNNPDALSA